jgi:hypothetical protein
VYTKREGPEMYAYEIGTMTSQGFWHVDDILPVYYTEWPVVISEASKYEDALGVSILIVNLKSDKRWYTDGKIAKTDSEGRYL